MTNFRLPRLSGSAFRASLLCTALIAAPALFPAALAQDRGVAALLDQANYWKLQNRPDQVVRTLERVLQVDPRNADALAGLAEAQAQLGNVAQAQQALGQLRATAPADPRTVQADVAVRTSTVDAGQLAQARQLAQAGRNAEAVERYRALFGGAPVPDSFALEYYQALAGTEAGWREARDGLGRLAQRNPTNTAVQLANAQVLTYREETRAQGIEALRRLSGQPGSQQSASAAWRQALTWLGQGPEAVQPLEGYLQQFPNDAEIQRRLEEARAQVQPVDPTGNLRMDGWEAFGQGQIRAAEERFNAVLAINPNDADGLGGLGLVRLRQGRRAEAARLLQAAIDADPSRRANWEEALRGATTVARGPAGGGRGAATGGGGGGGGAPGPDIQAARNLFAAGNYSQAEPILARIVARGGGDRPDAEALQGDIALRQGNPALAEERYRAALARRSNFGAAMSGLANALQEQGKFAEAEEVYRRIGGTNAPQVRAEALRAEAQRTDDPQAAAALLRAAIQNDPSTPWPRLELARLMARSGEGAAANQMVAAMVASPATPDTLHAAAIFNFEQGRPDEALRLLERVPARARSAPQNQLLASARVQAEVQSAAALARIGRRQEARTRLVAIASRRDPTGEAGPAAVRALNAINDPRGAQEAARAYAIAARGQPPAAQLAAAAALAEAGLNADAAQAAVAIDPRRLTSEQRRQANDLSAGLSIRAADQLNQRGQQAAAFDVLAPTLRQNPENPAANLALARLYQGARDPEQAGRIAEAVLSRNPRDTDARQAAMDAAIANRDWGKAEALLSEGRALMPNDPRIPLLEARLARAWGDQRRARNALEAAAEMRRQQIGLTDQPGLLGGSMVPQATLPGQPAPQPGYENPFRRVPLSGQDFGQAPAQGRMQGQQFAQAQGFGGQGYAPQGLAVAAPPADPLLSEINRQLGEVRREAAPRITPAIGMRVRSGDDGIDSLTETHAGAEGSIAVPGIGGRLTARASAVSLDSGDLAQTLSSMRRFGGYPAVLAGNNGTLTQAQAATTRNAETSQSGVALGAAYSLGNFSVDIGTTPLGFLRENMVGGIEIAPEIGDGVRLRLTAERRAMTDSLLAWGGARDPALGSTWGGVVRTGGRAQIEFSSGETNFYIAGGYYSMSGEGVAENSRIEAGAGFQTPIWRSATEELVTGLDLVYFAYDKNLRFFTLGHGGYYSPQSFIAANVPIDYRGRSNNLFYRVGASIGVASFTEDRTAVFPNDTGLQSALEARAASESGVDAFYAGQSKTGLTGGLRGDIEYMITPQLRIGGALRFDQAADWSETRGLVYARYRFDR
ncbi:cellulose biosynthesis protein BcsC [Falsiroseomonas tokyonensis]|uniref:Cellulose synthase subunit BcsC-related outer membrane protein n=1 Tax=Falsiroseomonas tokyonensis TaxID=430521 RepID=A0ABV7BNM4_9PROT|nr:cellulose biosynthesis protein BcsC [Falsiroseomonas tokyonensis]MBU8536437.1 BCSC C-terminal domain-containing protein [Falsiroseomonas tokyonensis]